VELEDKQILQPETPVVKRHATVEESQLQRKSQEADDDFGGFRSKAELHVEESRRKDLELEDRKTRESASGRTELA
jgi:hypothetical protein